MQNSDSKNILLSVIGVAILLVAVVGITYAIFIFAGRGMTKNTISTGNISMQYNEGDNVISITNAFPISDSVGKKQNEYFDFSVTADITGNASIDYEVRARRVDISDSNRLSNEEVNIYLEKKVAGVYKEEMSPKTFNVTPTTLKNVYVNKDTMLLYKGTMSGSSTRDDFRLRMWIKDNQQIYTSEKVYKLKVDVYSSLNTK